MDQFSKSCLLVIILLLAIIALRPFVSPPAAIAAEHYKYLVLNVAPFSNSMQAELDKRVADGWELAAPLFSEQIPGITLIFRKER